MTTSWTEQGAATLASAIAAVARAASPAEAGSQLLAGALRISGAQRGRLYLFNLATGRFESYASASGGVGAVDLRVATFRDADPSSLPPLERAAVLGVPVIVPSIGGGDDAALQIGRAPSRVVIPIVRSATCIALVDLDAEGPGQFTDGAIVGVLEPLTSLVVQIYERRYLLQLLAEGQQTIDFTSHDQDFFEQVMTLVALTSQMEYAALRELTEEGELVCVGAFGLGDVTKDELTISPLADYPAFAAVVSSKKVDVARDLRAPSYESLRTLVGGYGVASVVLLPVFAGREFFGVLSLGSSAEYGYTQHELSALGSVAGEVGRAVLNHRSFQRSALASASYAEIGLAITGVEVAQAARHEARGLIDDCVVTMTTLVQELRRLPSGKPATNALECINDIDSTLQDLSRVLDKIKSATRAPGRDRSLVSLREVWEQARSQLIGKFASARLESCRYEGPDVMVYVAVDWFRQVFINLILNSLEAFADGAANKRGRHVRLVVDRPSERQRDYVITYSDNAGGINPAALRHLDGSTVANAIEQAIFQPNVSSKASGSGWGLALVRRILEDHRATINVIDYRGGVTFRLQMPKPTAAVGG